MSGPLLRPSLFTALAVVLLALSGCAASGASSTYERDVPYPDYAAAEPVRGMERSMLCHQGRTITIVNIAVDAHLRHGDYFGACGEDNRTRTDAYYRDYDGQGADDDRTDG